MKLVNAIDNEAVDTRTILRRRSHNFLSHRGRCLTPKWQMKAGWRMQPWLRSALGNLRPYVPGRAGPQAEPNQIFLASNENPLGPSPRAVEAILAMLSQLHRYPDLTGISLREHLAEFWQMPPDQILIGNGSGQLIAALARALIDPGGHAVTTDLTFPSYTQAVRIMDGMVTRVPLLANYDIDLPQLVGAITAKTKLLFLCNPNNPTGTAFGRTTLDRLLSEVGHRAVIAIDEAYAEYAAPAQFQSAVRWISPDRPLVVLRTFSKIYGLAGARIGYLLGPPHLVEAVGRVLAPFSVSAVAQAAARAALDDVSHVTHSLDLNTRERIRLESVLTALGLAVTPSQANFLFVDFGRPVVPMVDALKERHIIIRPGLQWQRPHHARITIGTAEDNTALLQALGHILGTPAVPLAPPHLRKEDGHAATPKS